MNRLKSQSRLKWIFSLCLLFFSVTLIPDQARSDESSKWTVRIVLPAWKQRFRWDVGNTYRSSKSLMQRKKARLSMVDDSGTLRFSSERSIDEASSLSLKVVGGDNLYIADENTEIFAVTLQTALFPGAQTKAVRFDRIACGFQKTLDALYQSLKFPDHKSIYLRSTASWNLDETHVKYAHSFRFKMCLNKDIDVYFPEMIAFTSIVQQSVPESLSAIQRNLDENLDAQDLISPYQEIIRDYLGYPDKKMGLVPNLKRLSLRSLEAKPDSHVPSGLREEAAEARSAEIKRLVQATHKTLIGLDPFEVKLPRSESVLEKKKRTRATLREFENRLLQEAEWIRPFLPKTRDKTAVIPDRPLERADAGQPVNLVRINAFCEEITNNYELLGETSQSLAAFERTLFRLSTFNETERVAICNRISGLPSK